MEAKITTASDQQGWANPNPLSSKSKFHFFRARGPLLISLCGGYRFLAINPELVDDLHEHPDNCKMCQNKHMRLIEKESARMP